MQQSNPATTTHNRDEKQKTEKEGEEEMLKMRPQSTMNSKV